MIYVFKVKKRSYLQIFNENGREEITASSIDDLAEIIVNNFSASKIEFRSNDFPEERRDNLMGYEEIAESDQEDLVNSIKFKSEKLNG